MFLRVYEVRVLRLVLPSAELLGRSLFTVVHPHGARPAQQLRTVLGLWQRFVSTTSPKI